MTSFLFLSLWVIAAWAASWAFHALHSVYPFPDALLHFLDRLELWLVYVEGALICATLLFGGLHYFLEHRKGTLMNPENHSSYRDGRDGCAPPLSRVADSAVSHREGVRDTAI